MAPKNKAGFVSITINLTLEEKELLLTRAQIESRSMRQMGRVLLVAALQSGDKPPQPPSTKVGSR